jgi:hypothetical protein
MRKQEDIDQKSMHREESAVDSISAFPSIPLKRADLEELIAE